jgi:hypothetical protein
LISSEAIDKAIQDAETQKAKSFANQGKFDFFQSYQMLLSLI